MNDAGMRIDNNKIKLSKKDVKRLIEFINQYK